jgi:hypothetical protein
VLPLCAESKYCVLANFSLIKLILIIVNGHDIEKKKLIISEKINIIQDMFGNSYYVTSYFDF